METFYIVFICYFHQSSITLDLGRGIHATKFYSVALSKIKIPGQGFGQDWAVELFWTKAQGEQTDSLAVEQGLFVTKLK